MTKTELIEFLKEQSEKHERNSENTKSTWVNGFERGISSSYALCVNWIAELED